MWRIWWAPNNASRWQMGFNLGFKGLKLKCCFYSGFSFFMQLYRVKYLKCLRTRKYSLEHKCKWNLFLVWLFLAIVKFYLNRLDRVVLVHLFWALATFLVCFSVLSCWTNRAPSIGTKWSSWIWKKHTICKMQHMPQMIIILHQWGFNEQIGKLVRLLL